MALRWGRFWVETAPWAPLTAFLTLGIVYTAYSEHINVHLEAPMKTIPPAQAEHHLTHVADRFDHWRQMRTTPAEPMPQYLWEHAIAFTTVYSISRVPRGYG